MDGSPDTPTARLDSSTGAESLGPRSDAPRPWRDVAVPSPERPLRSVGFTISTTGYAIAARFREALAPFGLEPREFALLRSVAASEGDSQQAIGERMSIAPSRMVAFVDSLERRGLLERRQNPADRRARALFLTDEGRELLGGAFRAAGEYERALSQDLTGAEREQLLELLARVGAHVGIPRDLDDAAAHSALRDE
jgi:DNA-binding MarR family transcriptional regulator